MAKQTGRGSRRGEDRFPRFPATYRARWIESGAWLDGTLHGFFDQTAEQRHDDVAIVAGDERLTFGELKERSDALAAGLLGAGIGQGDLVGVQLPNWVEFCLLQIALSRVGAVIQPMHTVYREREMRSLLEFCESDAIVAPKQFHDFAYADAVRGMRAELPDLRLLVVARGTADGEGEMSLNALIELGREDPHAIKAVEDDPERVFYMNFTSGTEGDPKGFMHTHNSLVSYTRRAAQFMSSAMPDAVIMTCSPMSHSFGHFMTYFSLLGGLRVVLVDRYRPLDVLRQIQREKVSLIAGTPAHLIGILEHQDFASYDTSSIRSVMTGGARSSPEFIEMLQRTWGVKPGNAYGLGENITHTQTVATDPPEKIRETVGRPVPGTQLRIVDPDDRASDRPPGEVGEIAYRGPTLFVGYYKQPELTAATRDDEGWFYTGDLGFVDDEGYLHFVSRRSEVINRGGTKIYPKEIEDLLMQHPAVANAAVVGMPDHRLGERVCAYVVTRPGEDLTLEDVASFLSEQRVTKHKIPERLITVGELPMTPTGKVRKAELQADVASGTART